MCVCVCVCVCVSECTFALNGSSLAKAVDLSQRYFSLKIPTGCNLVSPKNNPIRAIT